MQHVRVGTCWREHWAGRRRAIRGRRWGQQRPVASPRGALRPSHAQVHPELLTKALLAAAEAAGGSLQLAAAVGLRLAGEDDSGGGGGGGGAEGQRRVAEVRVRDRASGEEREVAADAVVFCMGECPLAAGGVQVLLSSV